VDGSPYAAAIQQYTGADYGSLLSLGDLLLLADRAKEAQPVFERAYAVAGEKDLAAATESIARCMRAEDGAIGRANAWAACELSATLRGASHPARRRPAVG